MCTVYPRIDIVYNSRICLEQLNSRRSIRRMATLTSYLRKLNLFRTEPANGTAADEHGERREVQSTRVYIAAVILVLLIVGLSMWLSPLSTNSTIHHPDQTQFDALPLNAYCPCSRAAPAYGEFISVLPTFHGICSSDFVSDRWIRTIFSGANSTAFLPFDFRNQGSALFQMLAKLCYLAQENVHRNVISFQATSFVNTQALPKSILLSKAHGAFEQFQRKVPNEFKSQLRLLRELTVGNQLVSALHTSMRLMYYQMNESSPIATLIQYVTYGKAISCDCYKDIDCSGIPLAIVDSFDGSMQDLSNINSSLIRMIFPGLQAACTPVDSLLASTIEYFYNQSCVNQITDQFRTNASFTAMKMLNSSRFGISDTVASIVDHLFVEEWLVNVSYANYFAGCAPLSCAYSTSQRRSSIFVLMKLIGLLSSVTMILALIIPILVNLRVKRQTDAAVPRVSSKLNR